MRRHTAHRDCPRPTAASQTVRRTASRCRSVNLLWLLVWPLVISSGCDSADSDSAAPPAATTSEVSLSAADSPPTAIETRRRRSSKYIQRLSEYELFTGPLADQVPADGVVEYDLNSPLFTDYASKQRFVRVPAGESAPYDAVETFDFPVGTVIAKTFSHEYDKRDPALGRRHLETRILMHQPDGWIGLPYLWNDEQTEASLSLTGGSIDVDWIHTDGERRQISHLVPNVNDCKRCHVENQPIGPKARNINRNFAYADGPENQLVRWAQAGILSAVPHPEDAPRLAVWDDPASGSVEQRARAWLEINCAHCHSPSGPARNSGLHLAAAIDDPFALGVYKPPIAAGKGTGGRRFSIVPGRPEESILMYRLETTNVGELMPEFGRSLVHEESVALIRQWIADMPEPGNPEPGNPQASAQAASADPGALFAP